MKILFLACLRAHTGNATTAQRIRDHLEDAGHTCILKDADAVRSPFEVARLIYQEKFEAGLAIHLYKAGRFLLGNRIPFGAVFGGTDINEDIKNEEKYRVMGAVLEEARFAVAFTYKMKEVAATTWPHAMNKIHIQTQGILTHPNSSFNCETFLENAGIRQDRGNLHLFLLICGLRRVKDPLYLVETFAEWHKRDPSVYMAIIGPSVDPVFTHEVVAKLQKYILITQDETVKQESAAVLEAMDLEVPVLARNILGNTAIIKHEDTGLIFSNPQEFVELAKRLMTESALKRRIISNAKEYVQTHHSWEREREKYQNLILNLNLTN
ncbi:glycosyltransferase 1 domain-containing protein 1 [Ascaphus truei]|uniref:glycosyltransferase 1 domain-containing protein 1 n=1 Tax=Ascaphus truei TaxID=8439 RepID=UPI003F5A2C89